MKKTIIALMALAGVALAETVTINPLNDTNTDNWSHISLRNRATWTLNTTAGSLTLDDSNWGQAISTYDITSPNFELDRFSFDISRGNASAGISVNLIGLDKTISIGSKDYTDGTLFYGTTTVTDAASYSLNTQWDQGTTVTPTSLLGSALNYGATASITGTTSINGAGNTILTLSATAGEATGTATIDLGKGFVLDKIMICGDGANNSKGIWTVSNMSVAGNVPEPTTATLSLLALAGLAARRRRK